MCSEGGAELVWLGGGGGSQTQQTGVCREDNRRATGSWPTLQIKASAPAMDLTELRLDWNAIPFSVLAVRPPPTNRSTRPLMGKLECVMRWNFHPTEEAENYINL